MIELQIINNMNILIACEQSGRVRDAFLRKGHKAWSCDLFPSDSDIEGWHLEGDVRNFLNQEDWDMIIAFPPCTRLCNSGARWWKDKQDEQKEAIDFFMLFANHPCERIAIENPIGIMSKAYRKPDQIIRPFMFGEDSIKGTCLWLKGLPKLVPTNVITPSKHTTKTGKVYDKWWFDTCLISNLEERSKVRSKTFIGIAEAMAEQWG